MPTVRILVVDDHAIVRRTICAYLSRDSTLNVICQAADGEEAVKKAEELRPDVPRAVVRLLKLVEKLPR